ncbi:4'-phosphopantetheinyl transferase AcpT [Escherichia coli]
MLSHTLSPLPGIIYGEQGKPAFAPETPLWFNFDHSGDDIALLLSDEGEVGCDIEVIRPRANWRWLANAIFGLGNTLRWTHAYLISNWKCSGASGHAEEAIVKQRGGSAWQIVSVDSTYHSSLSVSHYHLKI